MEDIHVPIVKKNATLYRLIFFFIGAGILLQCVGFITPGWIVRQDESSRVSHGGLWYVIICDSICNLRSPFDPEVDSRVYLMSSYRSNGRYAFTILKWQIGCFFALGSSISALIFTISSKRNKLPERFLMKAVVLVVSMSLCLGSGVLSVALCAELANEHVWEYNYNSFSYTNDDPVSPIVFPYSVFLFGLGGLSLSIAVVFLVSFLVFNLYWHQMDILNALKYQVQGTEATVSDNTSCPENSQRNILSVEATIRNANRAQPARQSALPSSSSNAAGAQKQTTGLSPVPFL